MVARRSRSFLRALSVVLVLGLSSGGCSGDASSSGSGGAPQAAPSCRLGDALHEHQLARAADLRATPNDIVVGRLESGAAGEPIAAADSGIAGVDVLPYRIAAETDLRIGIGGGTAGIVRLIGASGRTVAEARAGLEEALVHVTAGNYTLEITSDGSRAAHYLVVPRACARLNVASRTGAARPYATSETPGVYVQEAGATTAVVGASTSVAAFVGSIGSGPVGTAVQLTSLDDLTSSFGPSAATSPVGVSVAQFFANGGSIAWAVGAASGAVTHVIGDAGAATGLHALQAVQSWSLLVLPDLASMSPADAETLLAVAVPLAIEADAFTIIDAPAALASFDQYGGWTGQSLVPALPGPLPPQAVLPFAATYFPRILVDGASGTPTAVQAGGAVAGVYASNDLEHGVYVDPAGSPNGVVSDAVGASVVLDDTDVMDLTLARVNAIRSGPAFAGSTVLDGARTLGDATMNGAYVSSSRTDLYVRASLRESLQWVVFEPSDELLWQSVTSQVSAFLTGVWSEGGLVGTTAGDAFTVTCDATNNPPDAILNGLLNVGVAMRIVENPEPTVLTLTFAVQTGG